MPHALYLCGNGNGNVTPPRPPPLSSQTARAAPHNCHASNQLVDQNKAPTLDKSFWTDTFKEAICSIGHTLLILAPWNDPIPLTRACEWAMPPSSLTCCVLSGKEKNPPEREEILRGLYTWSPSAQNCTSIM